VDHNFSTNSKKIIKFVT